MSTSVLSVPYTSERPIINDAPYPPLRDVHVSCPCEPPLRAVPVSRPRGLLFQRIAVPEDCCYGQAQHTLKSTCITGILEAEAAYRMESAIRFIDATDDLVFQEVFNSS